MNQQLFDYFRDEHGITLLDSDEQDIRHMLELKQSRSRLTRMTSISYLRVKDLKREVRKLQWIILVMVVMCVISSLT